MFAVTVEGIESLKEFQNLGKDFDSILVRALNKVARDQRSEAAKRIGQQIKLPARFLSSRGQSLRVSKTATRGSLEARITARGRPFSLARFTSAGGPSGAGVTVEVQPGRARYLRRAFLLRLPQGNQLTETRFNLGLAIRLRPGEKISNKVSQVQVSKNLYLLYGPSVQQVFLDSRGTGVAKDIEVPTAQALEREFLRLARL